MDKAQYELPQNCDFLSIGNNSGGDNECSPILKDGFSGFEGILINGPAEVDWPKDYDSSGDMVMPDGSTTGPLRLMIAGFLMLPYNTAGFEGSFNDKVIVVAVNQKSAQVYSGKLSHFGFPSSTPFAPGEYDGSNTVVGGYFNIDMVYNAGMPIEDATYTVYAALGDYKSNVLTIKAQVK